MSEIQITHRARSIALRAVDGHETPEDADQFLQEQWKREQDEEVLGALAWLRQSHPEETEAKAIDGTRVLTDQTEEDVGRQQHV